MRRRLHRWVIPGATFLIIVGFLGYLGRGAAPAGADISTHELNLVADRFGEAEAIDRWFFQQSWFHRPGFTRLTGAFGQISFALYEDQSSARQIEGAFCIGGTDLIVRHDKRRFVPVRISLSELSISFGNKLSPLGEGVYSVRELTKDKMVMAFANDGRDYVFNRKN